MINIHSSTATHVRNLGLERARVPSNASWRELVRASHSRLQADLNTPEFEDSAATQDSGSFDVRGPALAAAFTQLLSDHSLHLYLPWACHLDAGDSISSLVVSNGTMAQGWQRMRFITAVLGRQKPLGPELQVTMCP